MSNKEMPNTDEFSALIPREDALPANELQLGWARVYEALKQGTETLLTDRGALADEAAFVEDSSGVPTSVEDIKRLNKSVAEQEDDKIN